MLNKMGFYLIIRNAWRVASINAITGRHACFFFGLEAAKCGNFRNRVVSREPWPIFMKISHGAQEVYFSRRLRV